MLIRHNLRSEIGCNDTNTVLLSVGELNKNKNHALVIKALAEMNDDSLHYVIAGQGELLCSLKELAKDRGVSDRVHFLGFRTDIADWYQAADVFIFPSFREGLSASLMEAMAAGLPCVASKIRGNIDLLPKSELLFESQNVKDLMKALIRSTKFKIREKEINQNVIWIKEFAVENVLRIMQEMYRGIS